MAAVEPGDGAAFHQLTRGRGWWKPILELVLAVVWWLVGAGVVIAVIFAVAGVKKLDELDGPSNLAATLGTLALMIPCALASRRIFGTDPRTMLSVDRRIRWRWLGTCSIVALLFTLGSAGIEVGLSLLAGEAHAYQLPATGPLLAITAVALLLVPPQAAAEELLFRGVVQQLIGSFIRAAWLPIVVSALAFTAVHGVPIQASTAICVMGLCFAWLTFRTGGLEAGIALHTISNISAFLLIALTHGTDDMSPTAANGRVGWLGAGLQSVEILLYTFAIDRIWRRRSRTR